MELTLLEGPAFENALAAFVQEMLRKGVPSLYNDVCALLRIPVYGEPSRFTLATTVEEFNGCPRAQIVLDMVSKYVTSLQTTGLFPGSDADCSPTVLLWALFLQAHLQEKFGGNRCRLWPNHPPTPQHYSLAPHSAPATTPQDVNKALATIDTCIAHTPTALDMYLKKGKLLRKLGDTTNAAHVLDRCRAMDLQDRYLNNKATKYMLRADQMANAMDRVALFLKFDGDPQIMLGELQVCLCTSCTHVARFFMYIDTFL